MNKLAVSLLESDPLAGTGKMWVSGKPPRSTLSAHKYGLDRADFASMNQVVTGNPPLYTGGVNGCSVFAGRCASGLHFLAHLDSLEVHYGEWLDLVRAHRLRGDDWSQAKTLLVLTLPRFANAIQKRIDEWNNMDDGGVKRRDTKYAINIDLNVQTYDPPENKHEGLAVVYDGRRLTYTVEPKPWE